MQILEGEAGGVSPRPATAGSREDLLAALERELRRAGAQGVLFGEAVAERLGIAGSDLETLDLLRLAGPVTAGRLAEQIGLTTGAVTRMIDRLERDGYVRREPDPADRRRVIVRLVPGAEARVRPLYESMKRAMDRLLQRYSDAELALLLDHAGRSATVLQEETARLRAGAEGTPDAPGRRSVPLAGATQGRLRFPGGAFGVTLTARPGLPDLLRARFDGPEPRLRAAGGAVTVDYRDLSAGADRGAEVVLNGDLPWTLDVRSGASHLTAELGALRLRGLTLRGGASQVEITLPPPQGTVPLALAGGASAVTLLRPAGTPLRARLRGGASDLLLDGQHVGAQGRDLRWETPGFATAADRYDLDVAGGASNLTVDTR